MRPSRSRPQPAQGGRAGQAVAAAGGAAAGRRHRARLPLALLALLAAAAPLAAAPLRHAVQLRVERIEHTQVRIDGLRVAQVPGDAGGGHLTLSARRLALPAAGVDLAEIDFACPLAPDAADPALWNCQGPLHWRGGASGWQLAWRGDLALGQGQLRLGRGIAELQVDLPLGGRPAAVQARRLPVAWLAPWLPGVSWREGRLDGRLEQGSAGADTTWRGHLQASGLTAEAAGGAAAVEALTLGGGLDLRLGAAGAFAVSARPALDRGDLLVGPVFASWPAGSAVSLAIDLRGGPGGIELRQFRLVDDGTRLEASAVPVPGVDAWPGAVQVSGRLDLDGHRERYVEGTLAGLGLGDLQLSGAIEGGAAWHAGQGLQRADLAATAVAIRQRDGAYAVEGLSGTLALRAPGQPEAPLELSWQGLSLYGLALGGGRLRALAAEGAVHAQAPLALALAGGQLRLQGLRLDLAADRPLRLTGDVELADARIDTLAAGFGWPAFPGRLDGQLPGLSLDRERLATGGGIRLEAFDGEARIEGLAIERPFGVAPALAADVHLRGLDLAPLTEVFGFGRIEGRLDGDVAGLRLLGWRPVAFDARLRTRESGRRRISQLAVDQLTRLGGGGSGGLQGRLLGAFDSFGYRRIGLDCRLVNEVCTMGGLDDAAGGFTILQGSGLPLITIRGFQREVAWPVLLERLHAALSGQSPEIR